MYLCETIAWILTAFPFCLLTVVPEFDWDARISIDAIEKAWGVIGGETKANNHVVDETELPGTTDTGVQGQKGSAVADDTIAVKEENASVEDKKQVFQRRGYEEGKRCLQNTKRVNCPEERRGQ